jgi:Holliday junction DNA helicase RuvB
MQTRGKWKKILADALTAFARALHIMEISEETPAKTPKEDETPTPGPSQWLKECIGVEGDRSRLEKLIAERRPNRALGHLLLIDAPRISSRTVAQIVALELGVNFRAISGPVLANAGDLAALLCNLGPRDVLFIDEIHRLNPALEEMLYPAMEDFQLVLIIGEGPSARHVKIDLEPFTLIGAGPADNLISAKLHGQFALRIHLGI